MPYPHSHPHPTRSPARRRARGRRSSILAALAALTALTLAVLAGPGPVQGARRGPRHVRVRVHRLEVRILSTMLADAGVGEWGFAALVEADGRRLLFDTGARPETVLNNARELGIDLSQVTEVVLSHNHEDHTGGLLALRRALMRKNPGALSRVHVGAGIFWSRQKDGREHNPMRMLKPAFEATGGVFIEHAVPVELLPGVWLSGPVPRRYLERNWSGSHLLMAPSGPAEDTVPEDQSLIVDTARGLVLVSGCGHAGLINTIEYARTVVRPAPLHAAIGGFHLFEASDAALDFTADKLREFGIENFLGAHCTGIEPVFHLRRRANLPRRSCVVGAVGASFRLAPGSGPLAPPPPSAPDEGAEIFPGRLAR